MSLDTKTKSIELTEKDVGKVNEVEGGTITLVSMNRMSKGSPNTDVWGFYLELAHTGNFGLQVTMFNAENESPDGWILGGIETWELNTYTYMSRAEKIRVDVVPKKQLPDDTIITGAIIYAKSAKNMNLRREDFEDIYISKRSDTMWKVVFVASKVDGFSCIFDPIKQIFVGYETGD